MEVFTKDNLLKVVWNKRVAEELAKAGHDVTVILVKTIEDAEDKAVKFSKEVKVYPLNVSAGITRKSLESFQLEGVFGDASIWDRRGWKHIDLYMKMLFEGCRLTLQNKEFMRWLTDQKFDLAFAHMYHTCPIGLIHAAKIPTWIWLNSGQLMDTIAHIVGVPTFPSYVPPTLMDSTDEMNFIERTKSFIGHISSELMWPRKLEKFRIPLNFRMVVNTETQIFRDYWDPNFPDILDLARKCPLVIVSF
ncbi:hypothetical protein OESDEN_00711 [Oesophagostomum dentatum]|uniref:glucuronosyltransferase n=1 Tax=Oesophagostomum dentatum TaxID=61180 RepID=A0A0B1TT37_OESDE|nr:hypothetical protein OESDEN_00711 [Oesophagostomum dentatum]